MSQRPPCRLHLLKATDAPIVCVIRRGPSSWFHIALWNYDEGSVEHGAWTKIKLYPERCGLSPDGRLLAVFALGGEWGAYFAVSKAPWLYALAAWRSVGTWTTGADIDPDGNLVLAGCAGEHPFHGEFPASVSCMPIDTHWVRGALFRELRSGWEMAALRHRGSTLVEPPEWAARLPVPLEAHLDSVMLAKRDRDSGRRLVLVSLYERQREYYLEDESGFSALDDVVSAHWADDGKLLVATRSGLLRVQGPALEVLWEYDMDLAVVETRHAPPWACEW